MDSIFIEPFKKFVERITAFLPALLTGLAIIALGLIIAWLLRIAVTRILLFLNIDKLSDRLGVMQLLQKSGYRDPLSRLIGKLVYWIVLLSFMMIGLDALRMPAVENMLTELLLYLPNIVLACIIIVAGYLLGNFFGRAALIASVNAGLSISGLVGKFVKFTVFIMAATMALELLGIGEATVLIAFAIVLGGVVLALAIAFGLGGKDVANDYIEKMFKEKKEEDDKDDIKHL
jgi:CDP-diglyceride synthetase